MRYVLAVARHGSFGRAAEALLIAQPSLSRQVRDVEKELGEELFVRGASGATVTAAGRVFVAHARQVVAMADSIGEVVRAETPPRELVQIGLPPGLSTEWTSEVARGLLRHVPGADVRFVEAGSAEQLRLLTQGRLDVAVVHQLPPADTWSALLASDPLGVAVRPDHPLASAASYRLADLDQLRVLVHSRDQIPTQQDGILAAASSSGISPVWIFARFVEHSRACAEAAEADAVLVSSHTAVRQLPDWAWRPVQDLGQPMNTWVVRRNDARDVVALVIGVVRASRTRLDAESQTRPDAESQRED
ncbi:DNA-binding transcriptional regulator, LysR family [Geodermatophilus telluris]|uniref:DNA-binding transcriptional regulator, LysR family n=2 Tax=Geodermatophilus telluris TaxID=1190417 RepID=A0A1G6SXM9_9ACTN|nr:DNA-binding transcriptional regulator, LysR family [Geodermatophilus telluris]